MTNIKLHHSNLSLWKNGFYAFFLLSISFSFTNCKKNTEKLPIESNLQSKDNLSTPPPTIPSISNGSQLYSQLSHLAVNLAGIAENNSLNNIGATSFMNIITSAIPAGEEEVDISTLDNAMATSAPTSPKFTLGLTTSSDLYQAVLYSSNTYTVSPSIPFSKQPDFYSGFTVSGDVYYTLLRIPEYSIQQNYIPTTHGSIIFIPKDVLGLNSYLGYLWNPLTSTVISTALNDDLVEDHIDNSTAYIVVVDFDEVSTIGSGSRNSSNCEGGWSCTDGYCDSICGETQSCFDCNKLYNKRLVLKDILINDDVRVTGGANGTVANKHFVSVLGGKYKIGLNAVVLHANGKFDAINGMRIKEKWNKNQVKRTRVKSPSKSVSRGTPTWQAVHLKDEPNQPVLLSNHFNIYQAKIYINMYEIDAPFGSKHDFDAPVFNGFGINNSQFWRSSTMTSLTGPDKWYYYENSTQNPVVWALTDAVEEILPNRWIDPSGALLDEIEVNRANVKFILKVYNK